MKQNSRLIYPFLGDNMPQQPVGRRLDLPTSRAQEFWAKREANGGAQGRPRGREGEHPGL